MAPYQIRVFGDPVLKQVAKEITNVDGALVRLVEDMFDTMYDAPGLGLAAPQVGVQKRLFVYDLGDQPGRGQEAGPGGRDHPFRRSPELLVRAARGQRLGADGLDGGPAVRARLEFELSPMLTRRV